MATAVRSSDPGRPLTIGIHMEDLEEDRQIGPAEAARWCDFVSMHGYPIYAKWSAGATDDHLLPFLAEVTRWLAGGAPILFEEFGLPTTRPARIDNPLLVSEADAASYTGRALDGLRQAGCIGALLWCFTDYASPLHAVPPFDLAVARAELRALACRWQPQARCGRGDGQDRLAPRIAAEPRRVARHRPRDVPRRPAFSPGTLIRPFPDFRLIVVEGMPVLSVPDRGRSVASIGRITKRHT